MHTLFCHQREVRQPSKCTGHDGSNHAFSSINRRMPVLLAVFELGFGLVTVLAEQPGESPSQRSPSAAVAAKVEISAGAGATNNTALSHAGDAAGKMRLSPAGARNAAFRHVGGDGGQVGPDELRLVVDSVAGILDESLLEQPVVAE